ncbi:MAG: colanic acid biosynthesis acetyltransferase WcaF [Desulfobacterales bacterium]|nr:colanic acid biosynthesis acetyltransferase WcaF [Desulfobacterales bacterium]
MRLDLYDNTNFDRGRPAWIEALWIILQAFFVRSWIPGTAHRKILLKIFGAKIGKGVNIKPGVQIKFPWRLEIGNHSWIGESVWIDNIAPVTVGNHCCISQGVYLCTGSHDLTSERFDFIAEPIEILDGAWLGAKTVVGPGVTVGKRAVLTLGSVAEKDLKAGCIYQGKPACITGMRNNEILSD